MKCSTCYKVECRKNPDHPSNKSPKCSSEICQTAWYEKTLQELREQCFHMTDEEAIIVVDDFLKTHPELLNYKSREWLIHNS